MRADGAWRCEVARHTLSKVTLARRGKLLLAVSSSQRYFEADRKSARPCSCSAIFRSSPTVSSHVATSIDVFIFETFAKKRCKETRTTAHATSRRRRVALPLVEELWSQLWATRNIFLCCTPSRAQDGDSAQRAAVSKVFEGQAEKRGRGEPKPKSRNRRRLTTPKTKALQHWKIILGHRSRTQQRMCSIFHCLAKGTLQSSCNSLGMAYSSDCG